MKRLINSTTILSMALYVVPPAAQAQDFLKITVEGNEVICLPNKEAECPEGAFCVVADEEATCEEEALAALAELAAQGSVEEPAAEDEAAAQAAAEEAAAKAAEEEAAAQAAAEEAAAQAAAEEAAAQAAAEEAAAQAAAEEAAAQAAAEEAAAQAAAEEAAAQAAAEEEAAKAAEEEAAAQAAAEEAAAQAAAEEEAAKAAEEEAAAQAAAEEAAAQAAEEQATAEAVVEDVATEEPVAAETEAATAEEMLQVTVLDQTFVCLPDADTACPDGAQCVVAATAEDCEAAAMDMLAGSVAEEPEAEALGTEEPAQTTEGEEQPAEEATEAEAETEAAPTDETAVVTEVPAEDAAAVAAAQAAAEAAAAEALADPNVEVIDAPVPTEEAVETLETALDVPTDPQDATEVTETEATAAVEDQEVAEDGTVTKTEEIPVAETAEVTEEVVTEDDARASTEEFKAAPVTVKPGKKDRLSDFEKVGLVALGALVVGAMLKGNRQVVSNTGDRVVVRQPDGSYQVYKDDNALLREPGARVRTETFRDGSTRTIVTRADGSQIVTIRDATGRVLQRVAYDKSGRGVVLIDDTVREERIDVSRLPRVRAGDNEISVEEENAALRAALASAENEDLHHRFSLRQIRNIPEVRWLAPTVDVSAITFESGSAAIRASEAKKLNKLGKFILDMIEENPRSLFLVEGHTDAVGSAASNLALSDRRAESVAKALSEFFDVPPENLVVQGYGESELKIDTDEDEPRNRRVSVRVITDLLKRSEL